MSWRLLLAGAVFGAEIWALLAMLGEPRVRGRRLRWSLCIVGLPVLGVILWVRQRRRLTAVPPDP